jgi:hypothetical protein
MIKIRPTQRVFLAFIKGPSVCYQIHSLDNVNISIRIIHRWWDKKPEFSILGREAIGRGRYLPFTKSDFWLTLRIMLMVPVSPLKGIKI